MHVSKYSTKVDGQGPQNPLTLQGTYRPETPTNQPTSHLSKPFPSQKPCHEWVHDPR